ncbi:MAG: LacI family DNA-binding transcriptional regulator [Anaerolineales bacterium]|nr:LacI family DNA-binding transcriptional regulator [Anaerolineales bacterium]
MVKKTTIVDIASAAGVSVSTVSRILNNKPDVAEATRQRVLQVIEDLRFAPQAPWQQLRSGRSRVIALHFPQDFNPPSTDIITAAALQCERAGYSLNLVVSSLDESDLLAIYRSGQADGMILMETVTADWRVNLLRQQGYPFVMIGRCADNAGLSYVDVDIAGGVSAAFRHLVELGHRKIGFVTIEPTAKHQQYGYATWALHAYEQTCAQFGLEPCWQPLDFKLGHVQDILARFLATHPQLTAIVTTQYMSVPEILKALKVRGLCVPDDISIVGLIDDVIAELLTPPLTSIRLPASSMGAEAVRLLIDQLEGNEREPEQILLPAELCIRGSTAPVRNMTASRIPQ